MVSGVFKFILCVSYSETRVVSVAQKFILRVFSNWKKIAVSLSLSLFKIFFENTRSLFPFARRRWQRWRHSRPCSPSAAKSVRPFWPRRLTRAAKPRCRTPLGKARRRRSGAPHLSEDTAPPPHTPLRRIEGESVRAPRRLVAPPGPIIPQGVVRLSRRLGRFPRPLRTGSCVRRLPTMGGIVCSWVSWSAATSGLSAWRGRVASTVSRSSSAQPVRNVRHRGPAARPPGDTHAQGNARLEGRQRFLVEYCRRLQGTPGAIRLMLAGQGGSGKTHCLRARFPGQCQVIAYQQRAAGILGPGGKTVHGAFGWNPETNFKKPLEYRPALLARFHRFTPPVIRATGIVCVTQTMGGGNPGG